MVLSYLGYLGYLGDGVAGGAAMTRSGPVRQAVVVIHGMGEQLPLSTLTRFIDTALAPGASGERTYYSRPESITGSFESRRFLAPREPVDQDEPELHAQTDFFEYHWADKMQGNRLDDLWPTFRRVLVQWPTKVPAGLRGVWLLAWILILLAAWAVIDGPLEGKVFGEDDLLASIIAALVSSSLVAAGVSYLISRVLPGWLTASFVDVVRYLDTSPAPTGSAARSARVLSRCCRRSTRRALPTTASCSWRTASAPSSPTTPSRTCGAPPTPRPTKTP